VNADPEWAGEEEGGNDAFMYQAKGLILDPLGVIRRRWMWMLLTLVVGLGASTVVYLTARPMYLARATVLVSSQQIPEEFVRSTVSGLDSISNINSLVGEVLSQQHLGKLIEKHDLYPGQLENLSMSTLVAKMRTMIHISPQRDVTRGATRGETSLIFRVTYESTDPSAAATVANELSSSFINASIEKRSAQARTTTEFLRRELDRVESELREANGRVTEFQRENRGSLPGDLELMLRKLERLDVQRGRNEDRLAAAVERLTQLENEEGLQSNPESRLMELRIMLATELAVNTSEHPNVIALRSQIERMESEVGEVRKLLEETSESPDDRIAATRREIVSLRDEIEETALEMTQLDLRVEEVPDNQDDLESLNQRLGVLRSNYLEFLRKVQEAELAETLESAQQGPRVAVLDRATPPSEPMESRYRKAMMFVIMTIGMVGGVGLLLEFMDPVIVSAEHFERIGSSPLLGAVYRN
jgi:succinoglycan biosynthesis transport protein ExoP